MCSSVLTLSTPEHLLTDASDHTTAGILSQKGQSLEFRSSKMNAAEQNYIIIKKKMLTVIQAVKKWRKYLEGSDIKTTIATDHKNLEYFKETRIINRQQARWALEIQDVPYTLEYIKGKDNIVADALKNR